jgi:CheY-like chemotaxis protein
MLRRLVGPKIAIETSLHPRLHEVKADPGGLEQVLMNLCVNARDAINGDPGTITIQTENRAYEPGDVLPDPDLRPGDYVAVSVGDTGSGIPESILPRIFEPFFTTKPAGSGTGLGLATAYGIVKQSGGALTVATSDAGTVFTVLLPRTHERVVAQVAVDDEPAGGSETILLVEDEPIVRGLTRELLTSYGYQVIDVDSAEAALAVPGDYDLLVSDVVMPGRNGIELASELTASRGGLRVLLVSGHSTDDMRLLDGNRRWRYLSKPFTPHDLAWTVRSLLDAPPETDSGVFLASPSLV